MLAPAALPVARRLLALRRRVVPAFAVAAAAATLTWIVVPQLQGVPGGPGVSAGRGDPVPWRFACSVWRWLRVPAVTAVQPVAGRQHHS